MIGEQKLQVPVLAYGGQYVVSLTYEQIKIVSDDVTGGIIENCGHLAPKEAPDFLAEPFFQVS